MDYFVFYGIAVLAAYKALCPDGRRPPCPDPVGLILIGLIIGAIAAVAYYFLFVAKRALECCDLIAVALLAYLFTHFIWTLFFRKKQA